MTNILNKIIAHKRKEVSDNKERYPVKLLEKSSLFDTTVISLSEYLLRADKSGIIAEFKRKSPSKGIINANASIKEVSVGYVEAGASALSILTDTYFFNGKNEDITEARKLNTCPILRKDFVIDEYQIIEAKSLGADAILLIAACLEKKQLDRLAKFSNSLGLEVLVELHGPDELPKLSRYTDIVGVNNRNLKTFEVSIKHSMDLFPKLPEEMIKISESGLNDPNAIVQLRKIGFQGFLIGEYFMKSKRPEQQCREFIQRIEQLEAMLDGASAG